MLVALQVDVVAREFDAALVQVEEHLRFRIKLRFRMNFRLRMNRWPKHYMQVKEHLLRGEAAAVVVDLDGLVLQALRGRKY